MDEPIRIFIGTEPAQWLATEVLKHSIITRTKAKVEFYDLIGIDLGLKIKMYTGFSFYRFAIPEQCGYKGKAIYLDADMVSLADVSELYHLDFQGKPALAKACDKRAVFTSVMVMDCEKLTHWKAREWAALINAGLTSYQGCMTGGPSGMNYGDFAALPSQWNDFDYYDDKTKLIHYTNVPTQPWKKADHTYRGAFLEGLDKSLKDDVVNEEQIKREIAAGHIYPNILVDMKDYMEHSKK